MTGHGRLLNYLKIFQANKDTPAISQSRVHYGNTLWGLDLRVVHYAILALEGPILNKNQSMDGSWPGPGQEYHLLA